MDFIKAIWDLFHHTIAENLLFLIASAELCTMGPLLLKLYHENKVLKDENTRLTNQLDSSSVDRMHIRTGNIDIDLAGQPASNLSNEQKQFIRSITSGTINNISQKESTTNEN